MSWSVYLCQCADETLYTGISNNVDKRIAAHNAGRGAKYTKTRRPVVLLWSLECGTRSQASKMEYQIKQLSRPEKFKLINEYVAQNQS